MSNYKAHSFFNLLFALPILSAVSIFTFAPPWPLLMTFVISFAYATLFMSPDVDMAHQIKLFSLRGVLSIPFRSYALFFKHRGLSHSVVFGTLSRLLWLFGFVSLVMFIVLRTTPKSEPLLNYYTMYKEFFIWGFAGVFLADMGHLLLDKRL